MKCSLIQEIGRDLDSLEEGKKNHDFTLPVYAEKSSGGNYLIVDELDYDKPVIDMIQCRTVCIGSNGSVLYDSANAGFTDAVGCFIDGGRIAIVSRMSSKMYILIEFGEIERTVNLRNLSKYVPRSVHWTDNGTFLLTFRGRQLRRFDILELDYHGRLLWALPQTAIELARPSATQMLSNDHILAVDIFDHVALELTRQGEIVWQWGTRDNPSAEITSLSSPRAVVELPDRRRLITDTHNNRIVLVDHISNAVEVLKPREAALCGPRYAEMAADGHYLICDSANARVLELDAEHGLIRHFGNGSGANPLLLFPRSVEQGPDEELLIADTVNNRIVKTDGGKIKAWPLQHDVGLFWPRCARRQGSGSILICDGRNSRILEVAADGKVLNELTNLRSQTRQTIGDPHDVRLLNNGHLLVTASAQNVVFETDWDGNVYWTSDDIDGLQLSDPHSAHLTSSGSVLVCDTGNNRIVFIDRPASSVLEKSEFCLDKECFRLNTPRYAEMNSYGVLIVDTGNYRILVLDLNLDVVHVVSAVPDTHVSFLREPRWAQLISDNEIVVSDYFNHRVLRLGLE